MSRVHAARRAALACALLGLSAMIVAPAARSETPTRAPVTMLEPAAPPPPAPALAAAWTKTDAVRGDAFVFPPAPEPSSARPVTVLLHGMCGEPIGACMPFAGVSSSRGWLVCPRAEDRCGGGTRWRTRGADDAQLVEASVQAVARDHAGLVDAAAPRVLVGFSLGGIAATQIAQGAPPGRYQALVVIASQIHPDAARLQAAGVKRVVLAAGDLDITSAPLQEDARRMSAQGLPTRFVTLGHFGHGYPRDMEDRMREPMEWVAGAQATVASASSAP